MSELGLSTAGSRQMLEMRHREWIMIWNANCDSARPKKRSELMRDLDIWERTLGARAQLGSFSASSSTPQIKDKDFDGIAWGSKHDDSFKALIANARKSRLQAKQATQQNESSSDGAPETQADNVISGTVDKPSSQAAPKADVIDQMRSPDIEQPAVAFNSSQDANGNILNGLPDTGDGRRFFTEGGLPSSSQLESSTPLPELETLS
jgi:E3 ubiquitin-protein ligase RAD18